MEMHRFIDGEDRMQQTLLPHSLEDYVSEENPVRVIEVFIVAGITSMLSTTRLRAMARGERDVPLATEAHSHPG